MRIAKIISIGLFVFILYQFIKFSIPLYRSMTGISRIAFLGVSALVFLFMGVKMIGGEEE